MNSIVGVILVLSAKITSKSSLACFKLLPYLWFLNLILMMSSDSFKITLSLILLILISSQSIISSNQMTSLAHGEHSILCASKSLYYHQVLKAASMTCPRLTEPLEPTPLNGWEHLYASLIMNLLLIHVLPLAKILVLELTDLLVTQALIFFVLKELALSQNGSMITVSSGYFLNIWRSIIIYVWSSNFASLLKVANNNQKATYGGKVLFSHSYFEEFNEDCAFLI